VAWTGGAYDEAGPGAVWTRVRLPLVAGEPITPLQRVLVVADSANGISGVLPSDRWLFVPPGVTVTDHRPPAGSWVHLAATTTLAGDGVASTLGVLVTSGAPWAR
jgi:hypothetical protein